MARKISSYEKKGRYSKESNTARKKKKQESTPSSRSSKGGTATKGYTASKNKQSQSLSTGTSERDDYKQQAKRKAISASKKTAVSQFTGGTGIVSETKRPKNKLQQIASEFKGGVLGKFDPAGREFETESMATKTGALAGIVGEAGFNRAFSALRKVSTALAAKVLSGGGIETLNVIGKGIRYNVAKGAEEAYIKTAQVVEVPINTKTVRTTGKILSKKFSDKAMAACGGWAGAVFLGKWGQAEAKEPLDITMGQYLIPNAIQTGDWSMVHEAKDARNELLDLSWWEKVALWSPISPAVGIPMKIKGAIKAAQFQDRLIEDLQYQQENGESTEDMYTRIRQEAAARKAAERLEDEAYYAHIEELKKIAEDQKRADDEAYYAGVEDKSRAKKLEQRAADEAYWDDILNNKETNQRQKDTADDDYWTEYYKALAKYREDSTPSNLKFGLL